MLKGLTSLFRGPGDLSETERRMYESEKEDNFRWAAYLLAKPAPEPLTACDLVDTSLQDELSDIGQYAEVAHGSINPSFIWEYMTQLSEPDYPLHTYLALSGSHLFSLFHGSVANLQGYIAYRPEIQQLVVAFSGTSSAAQAFQAPKVQMVPHLSGSARRVHSGWWSIYSGIRTDALSNLKEALEKYEVREIVITGHSMGGVIGSLFCLDIVEEWTSELDAETTSLPWKVKVACFGAPRFGNIAFAQHWREVIDRSEVIEYSIRIYNDGVPAFPLSFMGYRHGSGNPLYFQYGHLWRISPAQSEYSLFNFDPKAIEKADKSFPLGGHNYYNGRDMELLQRRLKWFQPLAEDDTWDIMKTRFQKKLLEEQETISRRMK